MKLATLVFSLQQFLPSDTKQNLPCRIYATCFFSVGTPTRASAAETFVSCLTSYLTKFPFALCFPQPPFTVLWIPISCFSNSPHRSLALHFLPSLLLGQSFSFATQTSPHPLNPTLPFFCFFLLLIIAVVILIKPCPSILLKALTFCRFFFSFPLLFYLSVLLTVCKHSPSPPFASYNTCSLLPSRMPCISPFMCSSRT